jgi:hypothetical protein
VAICFSLAVRACLAKKRAHHVLPLTSPERRREGCRAKAL